MTRGKCTFSNGEIETKNESQVRFLETEKRYFFSNETTFNCVTVLYEIDVISSCMLDGDVQGRNYVRM